MTYHEREMFVLTNKTKPSATYNWFFAKITFFLFCLLHFTCTLLYNKKNYKTYKIILYSIFYLLKSFSVSRASSPWPRRSKCRSSMSRAMIFSKSWFKACLTKENSSCESFHVRWFQPVYFWFEVKHHNCWSTINIHFQPETFEKWSHCELQ